MSLVCIRRANGFALCSYYSCHLYCPWKAASHVSAKRRGLSAYSSNDYSVRLLYIIKHTEYNGRIKIHPNDLLELVFSLCSSQVSASQATKSSVMNLWSIFVVSAAAIRFIDAESLPPDQIFSFNEVPPVTGIDNSTLRFRPALLITTGCHPFAAVDSRGRTSAGLEPTGKMNEGCGRSVMTSQVYARAKWHGDLWGILYAWYFPKDMQSDDGGGQKHDWASCVVWINNPEVPIPEKVAVSTSTYVDRYKIYKPPPYESAVGAVTWVVYYQDPENHNYHTVDITADISGNFDTLISWDHLTKEATAALNTVDFGPHAKVPFNDANFDDNLAKAYPN